MSYITITINDNVITLTQKFDSKELGTGKEVLKQAILWLASGTEFEAGIKEALKEKDIHYFGESYPKEK